MIFEKFGGAVDWLIVARSMSTPATIWAFSRWICLRNS